MPVAGVAGDTTPEERNVARVMAVDDDHVIRGLLEVNLEMEGHEVMTAIDGQDALDKVRADPPDLIILDVMMPNVNGWQVAEQLRADDATRDIPIIFLSARAMDNDVRKGRDLGADSYVTKPFDPIDLMELVRRLLEDADPDQEGVQDAFVAENGLPGIGAQQVRDPQRRDHGHIEQCPHARRTHLENQEIGKRIGKRQRGERDQGKCLSFVRPRSYLNLIGRSPRSKTVNLSTGQPVEQTSERKTKLNGEHSSVFLSRHSRVSSCL
jgi:DNA-binding response OmpR family regulator